MFRATLELDVNHMPSRGILLGFLLKCWTSIRNTGVEESTDSVKVGVGPRCRRGQAIFPYAEGLRSLVPCRICRKAQGIHVRMAFLSVKGTSVTIGVSFLRDLERP
jgi:hypothetical protein